MKPVKKHSLLSAFRDAAIGLGYMVRSQRNARIHIAVALVVITMGIIMKISSMEWCIIVIAIGMVLSAEAINTAIEKSVDLITPDYNENARHAKDVAAGAVLITAIAAVAAGLLIFLPKLIALITVP